MPLITLALDAKCRLQASFEVKGLTSPGQVRQQRYRAEPISVLMTVRRIGPVKNVEQLPERLAELRHHAEQLATERIVPELIHPLSRAIIGSA